MASASVEYADQFNQFLDENRSDLVLARGDRYEILPLVVIAAYRGIPIIHLEGGDLSGDIIDSKVRHAITHLSSYHFCTNEESHKRLINMGIPMDRIWNFGSLDVEFAAKVKPKKLIRGNYLLIAYHPIAGEDEKELDKALKFFGKYHIIKIKSNTDSGRKYGKEEYSSEDYINLLRYANVCVGNSSSLLKEASILGVNVVNVGDRQDKRLKPKNVLDVPCKAERIKNGIIYQLSNKPVRDSIYYKPNTSKKIADKIKELYGEETKIRNS